MSEKTSAKVVIDGKVYTLSGYEKEEYLQKVAIYIDNKIGEANEIKGFRNLSFDQRSTIIQLNIADDYFKAKSQVDRLEQELKRMNKEIFDLKQELVSGQMKLEAAQSKEKELEMQTKELLLNKERLEKTLEEALLDNKHGKYDKYDKQKKNR